MVVVVLVNVVLEITMVLKQIMQAPSVFERLPPQECSTDFQKGMR